METTPKTDLPDGSAKTPRVEFASDVLQQIRQHARSSMRAEICGVLIGAAAEGVTRVTARIPGEGASQGGAHVTFTQDAWAHIYKVKDAEFPSQSIVGWYHSHPGFGVFLSDYDLFIHENFFNAPHQVAWVYDPHSDEEGCFGWIGGKIEPLSEVSVTRKHRPPAPKQTQEEEVSRKAAPPRKPDAVAEPGKSRDAGRRSGTPGLTVIIAILAFIGGVMARPQLSTWRRGVAGASELAPGPSAPVAATPKPKSDSPLPAEMLTIHLPPQEVPPAALSQVPATPSAPPPGTVASSPMPARSAATATTPLPHAPAESSRNEKSPPAPTPPELEKGATLKPPEPADPPKPAPQL